MSIAAAAAFRADRRSELALRFLASILLEPWEGGSEGAVAISLA